MQIKNFILPVIFCFALGLMAKTPSPQELLDSMNLENQEKAAVKAKAASKTAKTEAAAKEAPAKGVSPLARAGKAVISATYDRKAGEKAQDDVDGDGLLNENETLSYGTNPKVADTDGDGLFDGEEVLGYRLKKTGLKGESLFTNPLFYDTDGDGLSDSEDPDPTVPECAMSYKAFLSWWQNEAKFLGLPQSGLENPKEDYDHDGISNYEEFVKRTNPLVKPGKKIALLSPLEITLRSDMATTSKLSMAVLSHSAVTGVVCVSSLNTPALLSLDRLQGCELPDGLHVPSDMQGMVFLARHATPLSFTAIFPKATEKNPAFDYLRVRDQEGFWQDTVKIVNPMKSCAPAVPELIWPGDNLEIMEEGAIQLAWKLGQKGLKYHVRVSLQRMGELVPCEEKSVDGNMFVFRPDFAGTYLWQVAAEDKAGRFSCSESRSFHYLPPSGLFDSDGDGFFDNEEIKGESDPDDKAVTPLTLIPIEKLPKAYVKEYYSFSFVSKGGVMPRKIVNFSPRLPRGFVLDDTGVLLGLPEQAGTFKFTMGVKDQAGITRKKIFTLEVLPQRQEAPALEQ